MGRSVELKVGNYDTILNQLVESFKIEDVEFLEKVLLSFGEKLGDSYVLLHNEYYEEFNSYFNVSEFIDRYYNVDSFRVFLDNMSEGVSNMNAYEVADSLGVELPEYDQ